MVGQGMQIAYSIHSDRVREARDHRFVREVLSGSRKQSTFRIDTLTYLAHRLTNWVRTSRLELGDIRTCWGSTDATNEVELR